MPTSGCGGGTVVVSRRYFPSGAKWGDPDASTERREVLNTGATEVRTHDGTTEDREFDCIGRDTGCTKVDFEFPSSFYMLADPALQAGYEVQVNGEKMQ